MEAESSNSGQSRQKRPRVSRSSEMISYESSVENLSQKGKETLMRVNRRRGGLNRIPNTPCTVFDNTCPRYNWLRSGWIAEERIKPPRGRLYRYYYDPQGQMYSTRGEVDHMYAYIDKHRAS